MEKVKQINITKSNILFFNGMINMKNFHSNLLTLDKTSYKEIDIFNIGCIMIKKFGDCENISSINPSYLIIHSTTGHFKEKNDEKYLILDLTDKYEEVLPGIRSEIETLNGRKELFYKKNYAKIGINTDDDSPLNKPLKFATLTIIIRCVLQEGEKLYPQIYLDECLYELRT